MSKARMMRCPGTGHDDCKKCPSKRAHKRDSNCTGDHGDLCEACRGAKCRPVTKRKVPSDKEMLDWMSKQQFDMEILNDTSGTKERWYFRIVRTAVKDSDWKASLRSAIRSAMKEQKHGK